MSGHHNAGQNHILNVNKYLENAAKLIIYLGKKLTNQSCIYDKNKSR